MLSLVIEKTVRFLELYDCCWLNAAARFPCVVFAGVSLPFDKVLTVGRRTFTVQDLFNNELVQPLAFSCMNH